LAALLFACYAPFGVSADLQLVVSGISGVTGKIYITVFNSAESFETMDSASHDFYALLALPANDYSVSAVLEQLPDGDYCVVVFHDENANDELDSNLFGFPSEALGFSNNTPLKDAPTFLSTRFSVSGSARVTKTIQLIYPNRGK